MLWVEKYRPQIFEDVIGQENIVKRVKAFVEQKNLPHQLYSGPAGVGKSTLALIAVKTLFKENWQQNFLELNASDSRGIDVIRNEVKDFARTKSVNTTIPKIIFLDEADALTREAQQALRRTMETYSDTVRFILSCNFLSKIIDPIQSRCVVFRFKLITKEQLKKIMDNIGKKEKLSIDKKAFDAIYEISSGDVRRAENILQSCASINNKNISYDLVYEIVSAAQPKEIREILDTAIKGDFITARKKLLVTMLKHSLSGLDIIKQIQKEVWELDIEDKTKVNFIEKCGEIEFRMVEGSDEFVQLEALLANFVKK